jgi:hypothetical protein
MESSFIPNLNLAIGRTSTPSSAQSRRQNSASGGFFGAFGLTTALESWTVRLFNAERSTLNAQRSIQTVECWALGVGRWTFALFWRVKGAWWPSRSSKPLLIPRMRDQGRFDSYPLRIFYTRGMGFQPMFHRQDADATSSKGGERMSREQIRRLTSLSSCAG